MCVHVCADMHVHTYSHLEEGKRLVGKDNVSVHEELATLKRFPKLLRVLQIFDFWS